MKLKKEILEKIKVTHELYEICKSYNDYYAMADLWHYHRSILKEQLEEKLSEKIKLGKYFKDRIDDKMVDELIKSGFIFNKSDVKHGPLPYFIDYNGRLYIFTIDHDFKFNHIPERQLNRQEILSLISL